MSTYEYRTIELRDHPGLVPPILMQDQLNEAAAEGWRLVAVTDKRWPPVAFMEREVSQDLVSPR